MPPLFKVIGIAKLTKHSVHIAVQFIPSRATARCDVRTTDIGKGHIFKPYRSYCEHDRRLINLLSSAPGTLQTPEEWSAWIEKTWPGSLPTGA